MCLNKTVCLFVVASVVNLAVDVPLLHAQANTQVVNATKSVAFSPDGKFLACGRHEGTIKLWEVSKRRFTSVVRGHRGGATSVAYGPNGKILAAGCGDGTVKLWNVRSGKNIASLQGHLNQVTSVSFRVDGVPEPEDLRS